LRKPKTLYIATHNAGKLREFDELLKPLQLELEPYAANSEIVEETGETYAENAALKARAVALKWGVYAVGDDSGVEVDALNGEPGLRSARFVSDEPWANSREILLRLMSVPYPLRTARMRAVLCLANPRGEVKFLEGVVEGFILGWPRGTNGFGVDPIFSLDGVRSLAEMSTEEKNRISHRAKAATELMTYWKSRDSDALFSV
jgi:XTP/dITP diphosphohydrolase